MIHRILQAVIMGIGLLPFTLIAQDYSDTQQRLSLHGSIQSDVLLPQKDESIGTGSYDSWALTNTYADLNLMSQYVDAGARLEGVHTRRTLLP